MPDKRDKTFACVLAFFLGGFGVHKFYLGRPGQGIIYLLFFWTIVPAFIAIYDVFTLAFMDQAEFDRRYNGQ